jgi:crotonobetainyl-CoA:carnitine CoA-transferase CaiB-like acyl-CoA transferase
VTDSKHGVLEEVRVLDFGRYIAGPYCACLLSDLGADVIRIEKVAGSEDRKLIPVADDDAGALFLQVNRNKRGLTLNPTKPEGREITRRLVASADVVVANLPAQALEAMGIDYASLTAVRPDIILTTVDAFGQGGPWSNRLGFDGVGQAMSGAVYLSGSPDSPSKSYVQWVDFTSATAAAFGTMAALMERNQTGRGQHVAGSLLASALTVANSTLIEQAVLGSNRVATNNRAQVAGPADIYSTTDGWIIVQVIGAPLFTRWAALMGEDHWLTDNRFATDRDRGDSRDVLSERMDRWCAERSTVDALDELAGAGIPAGPVLSPQEALDNVHIQSIGFLRPTPYPDVGPAPPLADTPVSFSVSQAGIRSRAPLLGEHTEEILTSLGYDGADIERLRAARVV